MPARRGGLVWRQFFQVEGTLLVEWRPNMEKPLEHAMLVSLGKGKGDAGERGEKG